MPEKCYPCTWTNLLPMYLDYTEGCLTRRCSGGRAAHFISLLVRPYAAPAERRR
jgi:hypothetical protein